MIHIFNGIGLNLLSLFMSSCKSCNLNVENHTIKDHSIKDNSNGAHVQSGATWIRERDLLYPGQGVLNFGMVNTASNMVVPQTTGESHSNALPLLNESKSVHSSNLTSSASVSSEKVLDTGSKDTVVTDLSGPDPVDTNIIEVGKDVSKEVGEGVVDGIDDNVDIEFVNDSDVTLMEDIGMFDDLLGMLGPRGKDKWGPPTWSYIHEKSLSYPETPTEEDKQRYKDWLLAIAEHIDCEDCSKHMNTFIVGANDSAYQDKSHFVRFLIDMHNKVNQFTKKEVLSYTEALIHMDEWPLGIKECKEELNEVEDDMDWWMILCIVMIVVIIVLIAYIVHTNSHLVDKIKLAINYK